MRRLTVRFVAAALTFIIGVGAASVWLYRRSRPLVRNPENQATYRWPEPRVEPPAEYRGRPDEESPEAKAVRMAEEFIARNGYTDLPPARDMLSYETVEMARDVDEMLRWRHDTLERKAYGVRHGGRMGAKGGWTVVFQNTPRYRDEKNVWGRAVTMDKDFKNLRVEHKSFPLGNVDKVL